MIPSSTYVIAPFPLKHFDSFLPQLQPIGKCMGFPEGTIYRETNKNMTFPFRNLTAGGLDIDGDGKVDIKNNAADGLRLPFWTSMALAGFALGSLLL